MGRSIGGSANRVSAMVAVVALVGACGSSEVPSATSTPPPQSSALPSPTSSPSQAPSLEAAQPASVEIDGRLFLAGLTGEHEQYFVIRDGQRESFFEADGCHPCVSVSPDARYVSHPWITPSEQFSAAVYDVTTKETVELAVPAGFTALGPGAFSPDGERIARHGSSDADPTVDGIYTSKLDGSDVRLVSRVTDGRGRDPLWWSPDGAWILVWSEDPASTSQRHLGDLYLVRADGGEERRINPSDTSVRAIIRYGSAASFSPDGARVAFVALQTDDPDRGSVYVADVASGAATQLTPWAAGRSSVVWSPTADLILVDGGAQPERSFSMVRPDDATERTLWTSTAEDDGCCATWSPDGSQIMFQRGTRDAMELWLMDLDGAILGRYDAVGPGDWIWHLWAP